MTRKGGGERVSHAMHTVPEKPEEAKRREDKGAGGRRGGECRAGLKLSRGIGKIFELSRRSNYELRRTKPTLWRCARAFAHTGTPSFAAMGIERETRNFRGVLASADASECGWVDRWMDDTVKKTLV